MVDLVRNARRWPALLAFAVLLVATVVAAPRAEAAPCTGQFTVTGIHSPVFYTDFGDNISGMYLGYAVTNTTGAAVDDLSVSVDGFSGVVGLAPNEDGSQHFGSVAAGATVYAYFYVTASSLSNSAQPHTVNVFSGAAIPANEVCETPQQLSRVVNAISANANKVTAVTNGPNPQQLGGLMTITVTGDTGQLGGAGIFALTPASRLNWPANAYQMIDVTMELTAEGAPPGTGTNYNDTLFLSGLPGQKFSYTIVYTFVAQAATTAPTSVAPINNISSGNPVKHTSTGTAEYQAIPPLTPAVNRLWLEKSAAPSLLVAGGKTVYTVTVHNDGAIAASLDALVDTLPSAPGVVTYDPTVTPTFAGSPVPAPAISGQQLTFSGLFTVPAGGTSTLTYGVDVPNVNGTYQNSVIGQLGPDPVIIDTTRDDLSDSSPATAGVTVGPLEADLGISKTDGLATVTAGDPTVHTYTLTVINNGPTVAQDVVVDDTWPVALTEGSITPSQGSCVPGPSFTCNLGDLDPSDTATITVDYTVPSDAAPGPVTNAATVSSATTDPGPTPNTASDMNTVVRDVTLTATKTFTDASVPAGTGGHTFTIEIANTGQSDAANVTVTDIVDPALSVVSVDCDGGTDSSAGNSVDCTFPTLAGGAGASITVTYDVPGATPAGPVANSATVQSDTAGPVVAADSVDVTENVILDISKTFADATVTAGNGTTHSFDVTVTNSGTTTADNAVLSDVVDPALLVTGTNCAGLGGIDDTAGNSVECSGLTIGPGAVVTLTVTYTVAAGTDTQTVSNVAQVASDEQAATGSAPATVDIVENVALLAFKTFTVDPVAAGTTGSAFTIDVANSGSSDADNVSIVDTVDPALTVTGTDCAAQGGTDTTSGNSVGCLLPSLAAGASVTLTVTFDVPATAEPALVANTAQVSSDEQAATDSNVATVAITEDVALSAVKAFGAGPVVAGSTGNTFTIVISNAGSSDADNVRITDLVDPALTVTATDCATLGGIDSTLGNSVDCTLPTLAGGASVTLTITYAVPASADTGSLLNTAQVASDEQVATDSNTASVDVTEDVAITLDKTFTDPVVVAGGAPSSMTITATNTGLSDSENVSITDTVDSALTVTGTDCAAQGGIDATVGNAVACTFPSLGSGASVTLTVSYLVDGSVAPGSITNTAGASSDEQGPTSSNTATVDVARDVGLLVAKSFTPSAIDGGTTGNEFTIAVTNLGTSDAVNVVVADTVDGRLAVSAVDCGGGTDTSSGQVVTCTFASLASGGTSTITVTYGVNASQESATITNVASATDADSNSATGSGTVTISENVVLAVTKLPTPPSVIAGTGGHQFSIIVENLGTSDAESINVTDTFDGRLTVTAVDCGGGTNASSGQDVDCTFAALAPGASATIAVTYDVDGAVASDLVPNTALAVDADGNAASGLSSVEVVSVIDLDAVKRFTPATAPAGSTGNQMTFTVTNNGISDATAVVVTDTVDGRLEVTATDCGGGTDTSVGQNVTCTFASLAAGASATVTVTYDIDSSVTPTSIGNQLDVIDSAGNTATSLSSVNVFGSVRLSATKSFAPTTVDAGSSGNQFSVTVTNDGLSDTSGVLVTDTVDPRLAVTSVSCPGGTNSSAGQDIACTFASLPAGTSVSVVVTYAVSDTVDAGTLPNVVAVTDSNGNAGSAFASVVVAEDVALAVFKTFANDPIEAGSGPHTFAMAVTNNGISSADNVVVTDSVDPALVVTGVTVDTGGTCDAPSASVRCTIPTLTSGATATVTVTYTAASGPSTTIANTARAVSDETIIVATGTDTVSLVNPRVSMTKTADLTTINPGDAVTYTYLVTNDGDVHMTDVIVVDDAGTPGTPADDVTTACDPAAWPVAPGGTVSCTWTVNLTTDTTNMAAVTANPSDPTGVDLPGLGDVTATASETVNVLITGLTIAKSTSTPIVPSGSTASYAYLVENTGDDPLSAVAVTDDRCSGPVFDSEQTGDGDTVLDAGEIWRFTCDVVVTGDVTNTAFALAIDDLGQTVTSPADSVTVDVIDPAVQLRKTADAAQVIPGTTITFTIEAENTGDDPLTNVVVTDDTCAGLTLTGGDGPTVGVLDPGEIWTHTCTAVAGTTDVTNTAGIVAEDSLGRPVAGSATTTVLVNEPPLIVDDVVATNQDTPVTIEVLANDSEPDGTIDPTSVIIVAGPANGSVLVDPVTGDVTYTPDAGIFGTDTFEYEACDNEGACATATVTVSVNGAPVTNPDEGITNEATPLDLDVLANDTDPEGDPLAVSGFPSPPVNGTAVIEPDGTITYTPNTGFTGTEVFTYEVCDGAGACTEETVTVTINTTPVAADDAAGTLVDTPVLIDILANDLDPDGNLDASSVTIATPPGSGSVVTDPVTGAATYTPNAGFIGSDAFVYQVCDDLGSCDTAVVTVTVSELNTPPQAIDDAALTDVDVPVIVDVLANDIDAESNIDPTSVTVVSPPANGSFTVDAFTGEITYTPAAGFAGADQLTYQVCDLLGECDTALLDINVNEPPTANDDVAATNQDTPVTIDVLANDSDLDGTLDPSSVSIVTAPTSGVVTVDPVTGDVTYTPDPGFFGTDTFTYEVCDDAGSCAPATVTVTVNGAPQATPDVEVTNSGVLVSIDVLANDTDPEGDPLTVTAIPSGATFGTAIVNPGTGEVEYTPDPGFAGVDTFTYEVCDDQGACSVATVTMTVDGPPTAVDDGATTAAGTPVVIDVLANDFDPEGGLDTTSVQVTSGPANGATAVDSLTGEITYTPNLGFAGSDSFVYQVCDSANPPQCDSATVTVGVDDPVVNDPPIAVADLAATQLDTPVTTAVLANDLDPENGTLTVNSVSGVTPGASVIINPGGTITYTPPLGFFGVDTYTYEVCDDGTPAECSTALVTINVNDPPVALADTARTDQGIGVAIPVLANDTDTDGFLVPGSVSVVTPPSGGAVLVDPVSGVLTYMPDPGFFGTDGFTYVVCDNDGGCDTALVTVDVNALPVVVEPLVVASDGSPVLVDVVAAATDPDGTIDPTSVSILAGPSNGTATVDPVTGEILYTPDPGFAGTEVITYQLCDNDGACVTGTIEVTVNGPPVAVDDAATTNQDAAVNIAVATNDSDPDGLDLNSVTVATNPANGTATVQPDGSITYVPDPGFFGSDAFSYEICDLLGACSQATVSVTVNGAPTAVPDSGTVDEGKSLKLDILANDTDPEGDPLFVTGFPTPPTNGTVVVEADGTITYTPDPGFLGTDSFTYEVCDDQGACSEATISIDVNGPPLAVDDAAVTSINVPVEIDVLANDLDPESALDPATVAVVSGPSSGTVTVDPLTGAITYTPAPGFTGTDSFAYEVCDDAGSCTSASVTVEVGDPPPLGADDNAVTLEDTAVTIPVLANDAEPTGQPLFIGDVTTPANGSVTVNPDGTITYTPGLDFSGVDSFTYEVCDFDGADPGSTGTCDTVTVTVTVLAVNDAPVFTVESPIAVSAGTAIPPLTAFDTEGSTLTFSLVGGALPPGVVLNADGTFTGTTDILGAYTFSVQVCDADVPPACSIITLTLVVQALPFTGAPLSTWVLVALLLHLAGLVLLRVSDETAAQE